MAEYPGSERERRFGWEAVSSVVADTFLASGMGREDAALLADTLVHADLRGIHSHGVMRVPDYVEKLLG